MKLAHLTLLAFAFAGLATLLQGRGPGLEAGPPRGSSPPALDLSPPGPMAGGEGGNGLSSRPTEGTGLLGSELANPAERSLPLRDFLKVLILPPQDGASDPEQRAAAEARLEALLELDGGLEHWHVAAPDLRPIS
jgi:hypothetical protein